ncbi:hypothetical protein KY495_03360 [Massilia sp. PAMC28688]|uniref:hypothetical protein n=1 Tax=Massilia sp. PAMC28688 TaxID=2861283 RepID=UPI001C628A3D|nr:hypothetical protein [Massilia sp. PAMC28688]QYF94273.1 hypothetical protein KY495_03360 [Massilia sp. PAMC28688]
MAALQPRLEQRAALLRVIAIGSSMAAMVALLDPDRIATMLGMLLVGVNGYSQFFAIYVGVRLATAALALLAARHGDQPILGDITAWFILAQPAGRLVAAFAVGLPQGLLLVVCGLEVIAGVLLLALRPR